MIGSEAVAAAESAAVFLRHVGEIWEVLVAHAGAEEEGTRNVVAECLGRLVRIQPKALLPKLQAHVKDPAWQVRTRWSAFDSVDGKASLHLFVILSGPDTAAT